jgi:hypothetical protein
MGEAQVFVGTCRRVAASVGWSMFLTAALAGQSGTRAIAGLVADATGASTPGVEVDNKMNAFDPFSTSASLVVSPATTQSVFLLRNGFPASRRQAADSQLGARLTC